jgi:four helix bundle protein
MNSSELQARTKSFGLSVIRYSARLPGKMETRIIARQLMRAATSVGANYRAACRAKSRPDFIAKMSIVEEEADESLYWLDLLGELSPRQDDNLLSLKREASELVAIAVASKKTARFRASVSGNRQSSIVSRQSANG